MGSVVLKNVLIGASVALLVGCGGGGSLPVDPDAIGEDKKIDITDSNSNDVSKLFATAVILSADVLTIAPQGTDILYPSFRDIEERVTASGAIACDSGNGTGINNGGVVTYTYNYCKIGSTTYNGKVVITDLADGRSFEDTDFTIIKDSRVVFSADSFKGTITSNLISLEFIKGYVGFTDGTKFNFRDYKYIKKKITGGNEFDINGYISKEGFMSGKWVEVKTITKGKDDGSGHCSAGIYDLIGKNGSKVSIDISGDVLDVVYNSVIKATYNPCSDFFNP